MKLLVVLKSQVINSYYFYKYNFCVSAIDITNKILIIVKDYKLLMSKVVSMVIIFVFIDAVS